MSASIGMKWNRTGRVSQWSRGDSTNLSLDPSRGREPLISSILFPLPSGKTKARSTYRRAFATDPGSALWASRSASRGPAQVAVGRRHRTSSLRSSGLGTGRAHHVLGAEPGGQEVRLVPEPGPVEQVEQADQLAQLGR